MKGREKGKKGGGKSESVNKKGAMLTRKLNCYIRNLGNDQGSVYMSIERLPTDGPKI